MEHVRMKLTPVNFNPIAKPLDFSFSGKRPMDLAIGIPALLLALPLMLVASLLIRFTSRGPVIFSQTRIGHSGKLFTCYKLRTMVSGSPSLPTHEAQASCITPVGRILRRTKLDELPQLWNVLRGDMSLVGPRPCLPEQAELILHRQIHDVGMLLPGITGLAQIRNIDMSNPAACAEADAEYLRNWSLRLDLLILLRTLGPRS